MRAGRSWSRARRACRGGHLRPQDLGRFDGRAKITGAGACRLARPRSASRRGLAQDADRSGRARVRRVAADQHPHHARRHPRVGAHGGPGGGPARAVLLRAAPQGRPGTGWSASGARPKRRRPPRRPGSPRRRARPRRRGSWPRPDAWPSKGRRSIACRCSAPRRSGCVFRPRRTQAASPPRAPGGPKRARAAEQARQADASAKGPGSDDPNGAAEAARNAWAGRRLRRPSRPCRRLRRRRASRREAPVSPQRPEPAPRRARPGD